MIKDTEFTEYDLNPSQVEQGSILSYQQKMVIQNLRAQVAQQMLGIRFDPKDPTEAGLEHASLSGMLSAFSTIIENSEQIIKLLASRAAEQAQLQQDNDRPTAT